MKPSMYLDLGGPNRIARLPETCSIVGVSSSTVRNRLKEGGKWYDPDFPKPTRLGTGKRCAIGWRIDLLRKYIERNNSPAE